VNANINSVCVCHRQWVGKYGKIQGEGLLQAFLDTAVKY